MGIPDLYVHHGTVEELQAECGFDANGIITTVKEMADIKATSNEPIEKVG